MRKDHIGIVQRRSPSKFGNVDVRLMSRVCTRPGHGFFRQQKSFVVYFSMSTKPQSGHTLSGNPLHREGPARKKRRLSHFESSPDDLEEGSNSSEQNVADFMHSDPEDIIDSNYIHSDFVVEDRLGSSGQHEKPPMPQKLPPSVPASFSSLGISPPLQSALKSMSIKSPTEVQLACIPPLLAGM